MCVYGYINLSFSGSASWLKIGIILTALYKTIYKPVLKLILQFQNLPIPNQTSLASSGTTFTQLDSRNYCASHKWVRKDRPPCTPFLAKQ